MNIAASEDKQVSVPVQVRIDSEGERDGAVSSYLNEISSSFFLRRACFVLLFKIRALNSM